MCTFNSACRSSKARARSPCATLLLDNAAQAYAYFGAGHTRHSSAANSPRCAYLETRATDPDKQAALTLAYAEYRAGASSISRARFNIDVSRLDRAVLDLAIDRIQLPRDAPGAMPPPEAREIAPNANRLTANRPFKLAI
jgi:hypothetical protein